MNSLFWTGIRYCPWKYKPAYVWVWFFARKGVWGLSGDELTAACEKHRQWMRDEMIRYEQEYGEPLW